MLQMFGFSIYLYLNIGNMKNILTSFHLDGLGVAASVLCLIHCLLLPLILAFAGVGLSSHFDHQFEFYFMCIAAGLAVPALLHGYFSHHRNFLPLVVGAVGLSLLIVPYFLHWHDHGITSAGCFLLVGAHSLNWYLSKYRTQLARS